MNEPRRLIFSIPTLSDLDDITDRIMQDSPRRTASFVAELTKCVEIARWPGLYPHRDDLGLGVQMAVHRKYRIVFRELPVERAIRVERIVHGMSDLRRL